MVIPVHVISMLPHSLVCFIFSTKCQEQCKSDVRPVKLWYLTVGQLTLCGHKLSIKCWAWPSYVQLSNMATSTKYPFKLWLFHTTVSPHYLDTCTWYIRKLPGISAPVCPSHMFSLRAPPGGKWSGWQSQISWAYYPKLVKTNENARSVKKKMFISIQASVLFLSWFSTKCFECC